MNQETASGSTVASSSSLTSTQISSALLDFHCFSKLPGELQRMVWEFSIPGPRIVEMEGLYASKHVKHGRRFDSVLNRTTEVATSSYECGRVNKTRQAPAILHACKESRQIGQTAFRLHEFETFTREGKVMIYLDPLRDTVYFNCLYLVVPTLLGRRRLQGFLDIGDLAQIEHIACGRRESIIILELFAKVASPRLKTVTLVRSEYPGDWFGLCQWLNLSDAAERAGELAWEKAVIEEWRLKIPEKHRSGIQIRWMEYNVDENKLIPSLLHCADSGSGGSSADNGRNGGEPANAETGTISTSENGGEGGESGPAETAESNTTEAAAKNDGNDAPESLFPNPLFHIDFSAYRRRFVRETIV